jgi:hypothetical protein
MESCNKSKPPGTDLAVQELVAQLPVEALAVPVLPRTPRLDSKWILSHSTEKRVMLGTNFACHVKVHKLFVKVLTYYLKLLCIEDWRELGEKILLELSLPV